MPGHPDPRMNLALTLEKAGADQRGPGYLPHGPGGLPRAHPEHTGPGAAQVRAGRTDDKTEGYLDEIALRGTSDASRRWATGAAGSRGSGCPVVPSVTTLAGPDRPGSLPSPHREAMVFPGQCGPLVNEPVFSLPAGYTRKRRDPSLATTAPSPTTDTATTPADQGHRQSSHSPQRMRRLQRCPQLAEGYVRVPLRGSDRTVAQEFLDDSEIRTVFEKSRGGGVPQHVRMDMPSKPGRSPYRRDSHETIRAHSFPGLRDE